MVRAFFFRLFPSRNTGDTLKHQKHHRGAGEVMSQASYKFGMYDSKYLVQLSGDLRYTECGPFDSFLCKLREREQDIDILVDVTGAEMIDSTNLGLIAELAAHVQEHFHHKEGGGGCADAGGRQPQHGERGRPLQQVAW